MEYSDQKPSQILTWMNRQGNPVRFIALADKLIPLVAVITSGLFMWGLYLSLFASPEDYQQGQTVRIMYIHVPAAWLAMQTYLFMAINGLGTLVWKHPIADVAAKAAAPIGAAFTLLALVTGALWGKPMWGTWWVWDARLTSVLILLLMYLGLINLRGMIDSQSQAAKLTAILTLAGIVIIPVIKFSVEWWSTLHQPASVLRAEGSAIDASMMWPLFIMALAYTALFTLLLLMRMKNEIRTRKISRLLSQLSQKES